MGAILLRAIQPNLSEAHRAYPELVPSDELDGDWVELWPVGHPSRRTSTNDIPRAAITRHASHGGHRLVFRVFARSAELRHGPRDAVVDEWPPDRA